MENCDLLIVGCGFTGSVVARMAADMGKKVHIIERRNHIAGNMYDYTDENGFLVQKYGPHTFHTTKRKLYDYILNYGKWEEYKLTCMAQIDGKFTPTPFNFQTIDDFFDKEKAQAIKQRIADIYGDAPKTTIVEMLESSDELIKEYADFLFEKDYSLYTAKQWGISPSEIDVSVLKRVPVMFSYKTGYFDDHYQVMPALSFTHFFENLLNHENIKITLNTDARDIIKVKDGVLYVNGEKSQIPVLYTGACDELLDYKYGILPYRSLRFELKTENVDSYQDAPVVAYPQAKGYTRITEYTKIPYQQTNGKTVIAVEYPLQYDPSQKAEPYYPILTENNNAMYQKYRDELDTVENLYLSGRLADFKYYNMDQTLEKALEIGKIICKRL